jgi:hypothetical protein
MKTGLRKLTDINGNDVIIPYINEKYDEFYIISKQCLRKINKITSAKTIHYFNVLCEYLKYNDDRLQLSKEQKREIQQVKVGIDRQRMNKMNKELIEVGLLIYDGKQLRIPANIAWYGDKQTKKNMIKSYAVNSMKPSNNF